MAGLTDRQPLYLSGRSADVVLSEIRPTKLAPDALRSVNVLLDELLWMILSTSRSFATEQLKIGFTKLLPNPLGKEALLEAEVELKAYWDRTRDAPSRPYVDNIQDFPLHPAFELLRLKCESYSTFNDTDEDTDAEKRWQSKVAASSNFSSHNLQFIIPAALYLTAIIEHVCEHLLSNTGRVATRDSSRTTATLQDLFTALCEDDTIYGLFKNMKVHNQIETQSKALANRPRRSKSFQRSVSDQTNGSHRSNNSPLGSVSTLNSDAKPRVSSESSSSGTAFPQSSSVSRASIEKSRAKKLFGRMSIDKDGSSQNGHTDGHKRTASVLSNGKRPGSVQEDPGTSPSEVEFDELMRSGTTMKVSLTPDRLRTFDVYNKEKGRGMNKLIIPPAFPQQVSSEKLPTQENASVNAADETPLTTPHVRKETGSVVQQQQQAGVDEAGESGDNANRIRNQSRGAPPVSYDTVPHSRTRSTSTSQASVSSAGTRHGLSRKGSLSALAIESPHSQALRAQASKASESMSKTSERKIHPSISKDSIDESLDFSSDDDVPIKKPMGRKRAPTGVSSHTADLIDFLNSGPPPLPKMMGPSSSTMSSPTSATSPTDKKRGRLRSIVSRFKGSTDRLSSKSSFEDLQHGTLRKSPSLSHPPPSFVPPPLSAKRSLHNISTFAQAQSYYPKPPPPPVPPVVIPLSPPSSPSQAGESSMISPLRPRPSPTTRKAVPTFDNPERSYSNSSIPTLDNSKPEEVPPPTPSKIEPPETRKVDISENINSNREIIHDNVATNNNNINVSIPSPSPSHQAQAKHGQERAQVPERRVITPPDTPLTFLEQAKDMRRLLGNASTADECRLLVDMFLTRSRLPMKYEEVGNGRVDGGGNGDDYGRQERDVVETLLGNTDFVEKEDEGGVYVDVNGGRIGNGFYNVKERMVVGDRERERESSCGPPTPHSDENYPLFRKGVNVQQQSIVAQTISAEA